MLRKLITLAAITSFLVPPRWAGAQSTQPSFPFDGEITADDVYVRSGPGSNYYPTTKLYADDRVRVLGEQFGWLKIAPPEGSFSFVDMSLVQRGEGTAATISEDNTRVRAGSSLSSHKREVQLLLKKGTPVTILGEADGLYKITPPSEAVLWVSGQYVRMVPPGTPPKPRRPRPASSAAPAKPDAAAAAQGIAQPPPPSVQTSAAPGEAATVPAAGVADSSLPALPGSQTPSAEGGPKVTVITRDEAELARLSNLLAGSPTHGPALVNLETRLRAALSASPIPRDELARIRQEYEAVSAQTDEPVAAAVARARLTQLQERLLLLDARDRIMADRKDLDIYQKQLGEDRALIRTRRPPDPPRDYDVRGELRVSHVFDESERRYRVVDPSSGRTLAYVESPPGMGDHLSGLVGRMVAVRASASTYDSKLGVSVLVAQEIVPQGGAADAGTASRPQDESPGHDVVVEQPKPGGQP
jgi:hypothetical protein